MNDIARPRRLLLLMRGLEAARPLLLVAVVWSATPAFAQSPPGGKTLQEATDLANRIEAVTGGQPHTKAPSRDPCSLLPAAEVKKAFPNEAAITAKHNPRLEKYGIIECDWQRADGSVLLGVQESVVDSATDARGEALGIAQGFVDPLKPGALQNVRIERFAAIGLDNAAFIETADPARGIPASATFLALVNGRQVVTLMTSALPGRDRDAALKALERLGAAAAKSMR